MHMWQGMSPRGSPTRSLDLPVVQGEPERFSMHVLCCKKPVRLSTKSKVLCGKKLLKRSARHTGSQVHVHRHGTHAVAQDFRGVIWVGSACLHTDGSKYHLLRVCKQSDIQITWMDGAGSQHVQQMRLGAWSSTSAPVAGQLLSVRCERATKCPWVATSLESAYAALAEPSKRMIYAKLNRSTHHLVALINKRNRTICPTCRSEFEHVKGLNSHLGMVGRWQNLEWKRFDQTSNSSD